MNDLFRPYLNKFVQVYLDDILIYSDNEEEHEQHLKLVLDILRKAKLYIKLSKCTFGADEVAFLGHIVGIDGIKADPRKVQVLNDWADPTNISELRSFLGLATYFRKFIENFADKTWPLTNLTSKKVPWNWCDKCVTAFATVKSELMKAPVLRLPDVSLPYKIKIVSDASDTGIGAVLLQDGQPIAYESRKLIPAEMNYSVTERELLAVVYAMQKWRCYVEGADVTLVTDHCPNTYFQTQATLFRRQARWSEFLERFSAKWEYQPGRTNIADPLSRMYVTALGIVPPRRSSRNATPTTRFQEPVINADFDEMPMRVNKRQRSNQRIQLDTPRIQPDTPQAIPVPSGIRESVQDAYVADPWFSNPENTADLKYRNGGWYRHNVLEVPNDKAIKLSILESTHDSPWSGHMGIAKTHEATSRVFNWPTLRKDVIQHVKSCHQCQINKHSTQRPAGLLQPLQIPGRPWSSISMDFITQLPKTKSGHDAILVFVDRLTKMVHFAQTTVQCTAADTAKLFIHHVVRLHGVPLSIVSDIDSRFTSRFWQASVPFLGTKLSMSTAFHPQTDGQTERVNKVLEDTIRHYVNPRQDDWDDYLDGAEFAINNAMHESVRNTPFFLNSGQHPLTPATMEVDTHVPSAKEWLERLHDSVKSAKQCLPAAQQRMKASADVRRRDAPIYDPGRTHL